MNSVPGCWNPGKISLLSVKVAARAAAHGFHAFPGFDQLCAAVVGADPLHEHRRRDTERFRQGDDGLQARAYASGLEPAQHRTADVGAPGNVGEREILAFAQTPRRPAEIDRRVFGMFGLRQFDRRPALLRRLSAHSESPQYCILRNACCSTVNIRAYIRTQCLIGYCVSGSRVSIRNRACSRAMSR
jgi:hypothetical protein